MSSHLSNGAVFVPLHKIPTTCPVHWSLVFFIRLLNPLSFHTHIKSSRVKARQSSSQRVPSASRSHAIKTTHIKRIKISRHLFRARVEDSRHALKVIKAYFYAKYSFRPSLCQTSFLSPSASHFVVVDQSSVSSVELPFFHTVKLYPAAVYLTNTHNPTLRCPSAYSDAEPCMATTMFTGPCQRNRQFAPCGRHASHG